MKLLIADDEPSMRLLVRATVASHDYEVIEAPDGDEAWTLIQEHRPAIVLLDVMMPGLSGFDLAKAVKDDPALDGTVVILLTAMAQQDDVQRGLAAGADHYLTKPFSPFELLSTIDRAMGRQES